MLTSKQRSYLTGLSNDLNPIVQVGKDGVTPQVVASAEEAFNTHELIKVGVLKMAPQDSRECAETLAGRTRSQLVRVIGRKFILYRPFRDKPVIELP